MIFAVMLLDKTRLCIPASWVCAINPVYAYNYGVNHNEKKRIFFSKDEKATPNFLLPIQSTFHADEDSCYLGKVKKAFGTMSECLSYYDVHRIILPAIYSNRRERQGECFRLASEEVVERENERSLEVKQKIKCELEPLRRAVCMLNRMVPECDLTQLDESGIISIGDDESENQVERMIETNPREFPGDIIAVTHNQVHNLYN